MRLAIQVHECFMEVGHSRVMMELVRNADLDRISGIDIICYAAARPEELLPSRPGLIRISRVPGVWLRPFLVKAVFFQVWTGLRRLFKGAKDTVYVSIGTASFTADLVGIHLVHAQFGEIYFRIQKLALWVWMYRKALCCYNKAAERWLYTRPRVRLITVSRFVTEFCCQRFHVPESRIETVYNGVNTDEFKPSDQSRAALFRDLAGAYPQLRVLDPARPIYLFAGGYERKGLPVVFEKLSRLEAPQLIVIGRHEAHRKFRFPDGVTVAAVDSTRELHRFYSLADALVFPSYYETFGLVIIEAAAMGMHVFVNRENVGASELLDGLTGIHFFEDPDTDRYLQVPVLDWITRSRFRQERLEKLAPYDWKGAGRRFSEIVQEIATAKTRS